MKIRALAPVQYLLAFSLFALATPTAFSQQSGTTPPAQVSPKVFGHVDIPRLHAEPKLSDFLSMGPSPEWEGKMARVEGLKQRVPKDGAPITERTVVYLGYDEKNLYAVFVCFDSQPHLLRARMGRREEIFDDDSVEIMLDTFHDHRRSYAFLSNPLGVQADAIWTEGGGFDFSFDTLWYNEAKRTPQGFVVWMAIPFRSLRFASNAPQTWGVILNRGLPRKNEDSFWPEYTQKISGRLNQEGALSGLEGISPGRNIQFIPYASARSFRELDFRPPVPGYSHRRFSGDLGLDSKFVLKDKFVFDVTANPDFSQVESDDPQVTVNQRFELFFPEKRPFFLENANYFQTPIPLVFTRRIADPDYGVRMTGKSGPWALGFLVANDASPGKSVFETDPLRDKKAQFYIARVNRDIGKQNTVGVIYADREFNGTFNRVGGVDTFFHMGKTWSADAQAVASSTLLPNGQYVAGPAYQVDVFRNGRSFNLFFNYSDASPGFDTQTGFFPQVDVRQAFLDTKYIFHPESKKLLSWMPFFQASQNFDHKGNRLNYGYFPGLFFEFPQQTILQLLYAAEEETLRPGDVTFISHKRSYYRTTREITFNSQYFKKVGLQLDYRYGTRINLETPANTDPELGNRSSGTALLTFRPFDRLRIDESYIYFRLRDPVTLHNSWQNHILRTKANLQWNRELSFRMIAQYDSVLANPLYSQLTNTKHVNVDFLVTYLLHPGTAFYLGYNSNFQNYTHDLALDPSNNLLLTRNSFINDGRILFAKVSWLFRF